VTLQYIAGIATLFDHLHAAEFTSKNSPVLPNPPKTMLFFRRASDVSQLQMVMKQSEAYGLKLVYHHDL
jgi:hypothetical protein